MDKKVTPKKTTKNAEETIIHPVRALDADGNTMYQTFSCDFCGEVNEYLKKTILETQSSSSRFFNRRFFICEKCSCDIIAKAANRDPIIRRCNKG